MQFKYQTIVSDNAVRIAKVISDNIPLVVEYFDEYNYNQLESSELVEYGTASGLDYSSGVFSIENINITDDRSIITVKTDNENNKLFYQYQLKYDVINYENIVVFDEDNNKLNPVIEYGYLSIPGDIRGVALSLTHNLELNFDSLDYHSRIGNVAAAFFASIESLKLAGYNNLNFNVYGNCLSDGVVTYDESLISSNSNIEFYIAFGTLNDGDTTDFIWSENWRGYIQNVGGTYTVRWVGTDDVVSAGINITSKKWMRIRLDFNTNTIRILDESGSNTENVLLDINDFKLYGEDSYIFGLVFNDDLQNILWDLPLYAHRYSKVLFWSAVKPDSNHYRVRILLPDDGKYIVQYDGIDRDSNSYKNKTEWCSSKLIYKKNTDIIAHDWYYDSIDTLYFDQTLHNDLLFLRRDIGLDNISVYVKKAVDEYISGEIIDDKLVILNGIFKHDDYSQSEGILDYYHVPEYDDMYFAADNQGIIEPKHFKKVKYHAQIIDSHTIKINKFSMYQGFYPDYEISNTIDKAYNIKTDEIIDLSDETGLNYISARGINIYVNDNIINNSLITNYDFNNGLIELNIILDSKDKVTVTYLEEVTGFITMYPRLDRKSSDDTYRSFRFYLRADYPNKSLDYPGDVDECLVYRVLVNGVPTGPMRSCLTDNIISKSGNYYIPFDGTNHPHYKIMDITMLEMITIDDARILGGGIKEDEYFGGKENRLSEFPYSEAYLNIVNADGYKFPYAVSFIKINSTILNNLIITYQAAGKTEKDAMIYLKQHIEKHIAAGTFYVLLDENGDVIDDPYPSTLGEGK